MSNDIKAGKLFVFAAPSGAGKTTLVHAVVTKHQDRLRFSISYTTREPRINEANEVDYLFVDKDEFIRLRDAGEGAGALGRIFAEVPRLITQTERAGQSLALMAEKGVRLDEETVRRIAAEERRQGFWGRAALWIIAASVAALALATFMNR